MKKKTSILLILLLAASPVFAFNLSHEALSLNNKGIKALKERKYPTAIKCFEDALRLQPDNKTLRNNLFTAYNNFATELAQECEYEKARDYFKKGINLFPDDLKLRANFASMLTRKGQDAYAEKDYGKAEKALSGALELDPNNPNILFLLGKVFYYQQDLVRTRELWQKALEATPSHDEIRKSLERLQKEIDAENKFNKREALIFDIRFDHTAINSDIFSVREYLMECYRDIGQDFDYFPDHKIIVIFYKENEFRRLGNFNEWVSGLFDGKIRLPVNYDRYPLLTLKKILRHEYSHALVFDLAGKQCPIWINEGLAVSVEAKCEAPNLSALRSALSSEHTLSFSDLENFSGVWHNDRLAPLAYSQSYVMIDYLLSRWNRHFVNHMLRQLKNGHSFKTILFEETNRSLEEFEREWKDHARGKFGL
jgi:Flp pilus assembly protein TadD